MGGRKVGRKEKGEERRREREREGGRKGRLNEYLFPVPSLNVIFILFFVSLANFQRKASVIMVDELLSAYPHQLSFSEAGLRIMITSHFPPKTRLSMASRMLINEVSGKARSFCHWTGVRNFGEGSNFPGLKVEAPDSTFNRIISLGRFPTSLLTGPAVHPGPCSSSTC